ncbi:MAG: hypothetical protein M1813_001691 [Trichoglossum hirsutum]|nr:MAG: hypothetical protein M1813_001691 [Trichoglossum hirsutum]
MNSSLGSRIDSPTVIRPRSRSSPEGEVLSNQVPPHSSPSTDEQEQKSSQHAETKIYESISTGGQEESQRGHEHSGFNKRMGNLQTEQQRNGRCCGPVPNGGSPLIQRPDLLTGSSYCAGSMNQHHTPYHGDPRSLQFTPQQYGIGTSQVPIQAQNLHQRIYPGIFPDFPHQQPVFQQSPATMYTSPPLQSTFQHPLTLQELAFLRSNAHLFAQSISQPVSNPHFGEMPMSTGSIPMLAHNCGCGSSCDCLGCAAHPYNDRTMNFVRSLRDIMGAEIGQNVPRGHIHTHYNSQSSTSLTPTRNGGCCSNRRDDAQLQETSQLRAGLYNTITELSPQTVAWPSLPPPKESPAPAAPRSPTINLGSQQPWPNVGESDIENDEEESISPSAYFHVDYAIRGCTEEIDGCLCGEGCTCVGCLTHGGHDGVGLAEFPTNLGGSLMANDAGDRATRESDPTKQFDGSTEGATSFTFIPSFTNSSGY